MCEQLLRSLNLIHFLVFSIHSLKHALNFFFRKSNIILAFGFNEQKNRVGILKHLNKTFLGTKNSIIRIGSASEGLSILFGNGNDFEGASLNVNFVSHPNFFFKHFLGEIVTNDYPKGVAGRRLAALSDFEKTSRLKLARLFGGSSNKSSLRFFATKLHRSRSGDGSENGFHFRNGFELLNGALRKGFYIRGRAAALRTKLTRRSNKQGVAAQLLKLLRGCIIETGTQ